MHRLGKFKIASRSNVICNRIGLYAVRRHSLFSARKLTENRSVTIPDFQSIRCYLAVATEHRPP